MLFLSLSQMVTKKAWIPTPSQLVTKKSMLSYAKSSGNEKKHAFIRQVIW